MPPPAQSLLANPCFPNNSTGDCSKANRISNLLNPPCRMHSQQYAAMGKTTAGYLLIELMIDNALPTAKYDKSQLKLTLNVPSIRSKF